MEPLEELDAFNAPRLVSYTCDSLGGNFTAQVSEGCQQSAQGCGETLLTEVLPEALGELAGVDVKQWLTLGVYQIAVVRSQDAGALGQWLDAFGFAMNDDVAPLVQDYLDQGVDFMAARVTGVEGRNPWIDPIRVTYPKRTFSLPLQLGATNAVGDQEVLLWVIGDSADGEAQVLSFPEVQQESDCMLPAGATSSEVVEEAFTAARGDEDGVAVVEYSWDLSQKCDPCGTSSGDPTGFLAGIGREDPSGGYVTRVRMRFDPQRLNQDLHVQYTGASAMTQLIYVEHKDELEASIPTCFEGFPDEPAGTCDDTQTAAVPAWTLLTAPLVGWALRRRPRAAAR